MRAFSNRVFFAFVVAVSMGALGLLARAEDEKKAEAGGGQMDPKMMEEMEKAMQKAAALGPQHKLLEQMVGNYKAEVKFGGGGMPEGTSTGYSKNTLVLGGRFLKSDYGGDFMGKPFTGIGMTGYDNLKQQFVATWADEMSTSILLCYGTVDPTGKVFTYTGECDDPMTGAKRKMKQVTTVVDADHHTYVWYDTAPDGKEFPAMTINFTKEK